MLLADGQAVLLAELKSEERTEVAEAFCAWLGVAGTSLQELAASSGAREGAEQTYQVVAVLGFAADAGILKVPSLAVLQAGLRRLAGRGIAIDGIPAPICLDPVGVLGVALGGRAVAPSDISDDVKAWVSRFLTSSYNMERIEDWERGLFAVADQLFGGISGLRIPGTPSAADLRVALRAKGLLKSASTEQDEADDAEVLSLVVRETLPGLGRVRAGLRLAALNWVRRTAPVLSPGRTTVMQVTELLRRVPARLRRWTWENRPRTKNAAARQWHLDNEYHVQNLLYFLLAPQFPDLTDEQYLGQVGQKNPRADLLVPSLKLVIEVKFLRATMTFADLVGEVAEDNSLYLSKGSPFTTIVPFVWDDSSRSHQHDYFIQGVKKLTGIPDAVVISRPGYMTA